MSATKRPSPDWHYLQYGKGSYPQTPADDRDDIVWFKHRDRKLWIYIVAPFVVAAIVFGICEVFAR